MNRLFRCAAALVLAACLNPAVAGDEHSRLEPVKLRFDTRFVLELVAERMQVKLRPDVPLPAIFVESAIPLRQFQDAMEGQWSFRPPMVANSYSVATNEIYLSDDASFYLRLKRTLDDSLAHEFVHYIQAKYLGEDLTTDSCEMQAAEVQRWFREEYALAKRDLVAEQAGAGAARPGGPVPTCVLTPGVDGIRAVRCVTGARAVPG